MESVTRVDGDAFEIAVKQSQAMGFEDRAIMRALEAVVEADVQVSGNLHMFLDLLFRLDCPFQRSLAMSLVLASCWWYGARMFAGQNVCLS